MAEGKTVSRGKIVDRRRPAAAGRALPDPQQYRHLPHRLVDAAFFLRHDVSDSAAWAQVVAETQRWFGKVDALVNNAAMFSPKPLIDTSAAEIGAALPG